MADHESVSLLGHGIGGRIAQLRNEDSFTISGPGADRTANPDLDAREPWRAGDNARGLTPGSLVRIGALLR